jgi:mannose-1-phosphate guanylyltransferase
MMPIYHTNKVILKTAGDYYWNGDIFCFRLSDMISAFETYFPEGAPIFGAEREHIVSHFLSAPKQSIDYAVMEKARNIACVQT